MQGNGNSKTWNEFCESLLTTCKLRDVDFFALQQWILDSMKNLEKRDFEYFITLDATPEEPDQIMSTTILLENRIYSFGLEKNQKKRFFIIPVKIFVLYDEEITRDFIKCTFATPTELSFFIEVPINNSEKVRAFSKKIRDLIWG